MPYGDKGLNDIKTYAELRTWLIRSTENQESQKVWMALLIATAFTYMMFYTDMVEAIAGVPARAAGVGTDEAGTNIVDSII